MKTKTFSISRVFDINSDTLFQVVSDFNKYSDWNTIIPHAKGELKIGTTLELTMNMGGKTKPFNPKVVAVDPGKSFSLSKILITKGIGELTHQFEFIYLPNNKTEFIQTWTGKGILVKMMWSKIAEGFSDFEIFNDDLEKYLMKRE
ncbi:MAG: hypothetical protein COA57_08995 [Flavobacteriales bacterium]|nr:MAG: hypothetical protein COA57_08995 [Flavobacteriales bacterium]